MTEISNTLTHTHNTHTQLMLVTLTAGTQTAWLERHISEKETGQSANYLVCEITDIHLLTEEGWRYEPLNSMSATCLALERRSDINRA